MKKLFLALAICMAPLFFTSCDEENTDVLGSLVGNMTATINGESHNFTGALFANVEGVTAISSTTTSGETIVIKIDNANVGEHTLGFLPDLSIQSILAGGFSGMDNMQNTLAYYPGVGNQATDSYVAVAGKCTIKSVSSSKVKGSFVAWAVKVGDLQNLSLELLQNAVKIEGTFSAINGDAIVDLF